MTEHVHQKLSFREKAGYSLGDMATNFFFMSLILYQARFYTDTVGLSAVAMGFMFLILRLGDAVIDPVIGALSDRTNSRWGKFRPWILFTAIPFSVIFWLVFLAPHFGPMGKLIYAYMTYTLVMILYSANNTPYSALMGVMTPDASERSSVASYRFVAAMCGQLLIQALVLPLVDKFGAGDSAKGWAITIGIFGAVMMVCYLTAFSTTRERVQPDPKQKSCLRDDIKDVFTCRPWIVMFILTLMVFTTITLRGSALNYYMAYYLDPAAIRNFLDKVGLASMGSGEISGWKAPLNALGLIVKPDGSNAASVVFAFFMTMGSVIQIFGIMASKPLSDRFGKKAVFTAGMSVTILATVLVYFVTPTSMGLLTALSVLWPLGWGPTVPLLWVMMADVADFSEWKNNRRATGFVFAGIVFALKVGLSFGGALTGWVLAAYGYVPNVAQSAHAMMGIRLSATVYSAVPLVIGLVCLAIYPISKALNLRIQDELAERRKKFASENPAAA
jgi:Na+/melibiose symporter-like transporter